MTVACQETDEPVNEYDKQQSKESKYSEEVDEEDTSNELSSHESQCDYEIWKELENIEGDLGDILKPISSAAAAFWIESFQEVHTVHRAYAPRNGLLYPLPGTLLTMHLFAQPLRFMVSWDDFLQAITTRLRYTPTQAETDHLANVLGTYMAETSRVTVVKPRNLKRERAYPFLCT